MILFACITVILVLALVATQLKVRALAESCAGEKVRNDAQRAQFERDMRSLQRECEDLTAVAETRATRWKSLYAAALSLARASSKEEGWRRVAELFQAPGQFRVAAIRLRDADTQTFRLEHLAGMSEEKAGRVRETRVPEPMLREWMDPRSAFGPGFVLRAKSLPGGVANGPGAALDPQDAWLIPFRDAEGRVSLYISLAQPEPCRLPDGDEMPLYLAACELAQAWQEQLLRDQEQHHAFTQQLRDRQMEAASLAGTSLTLRQLSERLRSGLGHIDGYAQTLLDYGLDLPGEEVKRLARVAIEEAQELGEDALLVGDLADLTGHGSGEAPGQPVEFSDLYAELLQFLYHRAEIKGVTLNGPPLQGGLYIDRPTGLLRHLLALVSNELLGVCSSGHELAVTAWQDGGQVNIGWRASGVGIQTLEPDARTPRWAAAQAMACALGGSLKESTFGADNRAVSLTIPLAHGPIATQNELRAA